jgi:hypothetical protein
MEQRVSLVTLGVGDLDRPRTFDERLGWDADRLALCATTDSGVRNVTAMSR